MTLEDRINGFVKNLIEAKKKAKKGKKKADDGSLPGPLIGWLMNQGVIAKPGSKKRGKKGKKTDDKKKYGRAKLGRSAGKAGKGYWKKG